MPPIYGAPALALFGITGLIYWDSIFDIENANGRAMITNIYQPNDMSVEPVTVLEGWRDYPNYTTEDNPEYVSLTYF